MTNNFGFSEAILRKICVYCGSSEGYGKSYLDTGISLGRELALRKIGLVYGGASVGVMGQIADSVLEAGGNVTGVLPKGVFRQEIPHSNLTDMIEAVSYTHLTLPTIYSV